MQIGKIVNHVVLPQVENEASTIILIREYVSEKMNLQFGNVKRKSILIRIPNLCYMFTGKG
jgi:hypothetical protein